MSYVSAHVANLLFSLRLKFNFLMKQSGHWGGNLANRPSRNMVCSKLVPFILIEEARPERLDTIQATI